VARDISVVVVARNEEKTISKCLESLITVDFPKDRYEVIVVDGASSDKTREICKRYPIKLVSLDRGGISYQRNVGIMAAEGKYVAFTDADCVVEKAWLRKLIDQVEANDGSLVAVGGPNLVFSDDPPLSRVIGYAQETLLGSGGSPQSYRIRKNSYVNSIPNCNILYIKEIIAKERYDESLSVGDDCELNFRLRQKNYKFLYSPETVVWHHRPNTLKKFINKIFSYGEALGQITRKHKKVVRWYTFLAAFAVLAVVFAYPVITFFYPAIYVYASLVSLYVIALALSTASVYQKYKSVESLLTMILLPLQHFFYGLGFLKGLFEMRRAR
jgi:glycosyltransferase involved in cell wall biosynthesis